MLSIFSVILVHSFRIKSWLFFFRMTEEHQANMTDQTVLAQGDSLYLAGPAARRELSNQLTAAHFDTDLNGLDVFSQAPTFEQADTDAVRLKKLVELRRFTVSLGHKILKLQSAWWVQFETITPLTDQIQRCTEKFTNFGLVDGMAHNIDEIRGEIQTLTSVSEDISEQYDLVKDTVNGHVDVLNALNPLTKYVKAIEKVATYAKHIKLMYDQAVKLDRIEERRLDILDIVDEMPAFHLKANQAEADIQELKNQNFLLHCEVKTLKTKLATTPLC